MCWKLLRVVSLYKFDQPLFPQIQLVGKAVQNEPCMYVCMYVPHGIALIKCIYRQYEVLVSKLN